MDHAPIIIRPEQDQDHDTIYRLTERAFAPMAFSEGDEPDLISALRREGALSQSLVAILDGRLIGHVAFSPAIAADGSAGWFALGPVSVEPDLQGRGFGSTLIRAGLERLVAEKAAGCILTGNPQFYRRFGFALFPELTPPGEPAEYFMILPLACKTPTCVVGFHPLFHG